MLSLQPWEFILLRALELALIARIESFAIHGPRGQRDPPSVSPPPPTEWSSLLFPFLGSGPAVTAVGTSHHRSEVVLSSPLDATASSGCVVDGTALIRFFAGESDTEQWAHTTGGEYVQDAVCQSAARMLFTDLEWKRMGRSARDTVSQKIHRIGQMLLASVLS